ncbi:MAG: hypothetical protein VXZ47_02795, partial [Candidatus Thermoplasmatota archaeon]|nr:hypothetical protein [Candidatus Thermoplasmatota archaeon]
RNRRKCLSPGGIFMIPVSLYGVDVNRCESFYDKLPGLVADSIDDDNYSDALFAIQNKASMEHIKVAENWANRQPYVFPEEVANEIEMIIRTVSYPDVALLEHLLTIEGIDTQRVSEWMHFSTNLYPIYSQKACDALTEMGLETPYDLNDMASYGLYVSRIEGLKMYAPAKGLPEIGLPRSRMLQLGLERFE